MRHGLCTVDSVDHDCSHALAPPRAEIRELDPSCIALLYPWPEFEYQRVHFSCLLTTTNDPA